MIENCDPWAVSVFERQPTWNFLWPKTLFIYQNCVFDAELWRLNLEVNSSEPHDTPMPSRHPPGLVGAWEWSKRMEPIAHRSSHADGGWWRDAEHLSFGLQKVVVSTYCVFLSKYAVDVNFGVKWITGMRLVRIAQFERNTQRLQSSINLLQRYPRQAVKNLGHFWDATTGDLEKWSLMISRSLGKSNRFLTSSHKKKI